MLAADVITFVRAALPPRPARLLEVGAGRGELAEALVVDEFDVELFDERAAHWLLAHRQSAAHEHREPADFVADLRDHIHPLRLVVEALSEWFRLGEPVRGPHLHRWELPPGLQAAEEQLIAAGRLPAIGVRLVGTRR